MIVYESVAYFEIQASDAKQLVTFYKEVFGWKFVKEEYVPIDYYRIEVAGINGAILQRPAKVPMTEHGTNTFTCSMMVKHFDETSEVILRNGGRIALTKFAIPGRCWQGYLWIPTTTCSASLKWMKMQTEFNAGSSFTNHNLTNFESLKKRICRQNLI